MTNTELTLDQLTAITGGSTGTEYGLVASMVALSSLGDSIAIECKVPPSFKKSQDKVNGTIGYEMQPSLTCPRETPVFA